MIIFWVCIVNIVFVRCFIKLVFFNNFFINVINFDIDLVIKDIYFVILKFVMCFWIFFIVGDIIM